ncbi:MAG: acyl-CoA thioesterase [Burkholderiaceae bacterium]
MHKPQRLPMTEATLVHVTRMTIRWGDMDAAGHVNNTVYFRYMEQARIDWMTAIGCATDGTGGEGPVIVNAHCTFLRQLKYPGEIEVLTYVGAPGRSSFETMHVIRRLDAPNLPAAEGGAKVVWVNYAQEKSVPLAPQIRARLTPQLEAPPAAAG